METDQLACWLSELTMQTLEQWCGSVTDPCDLFSFLLIVGHRTNKASPNPSSGELEALAYKESI